MGIKVSILKQVNSDLKSVKSLLKMGKTYNALLVLDAMTKQLDKVCYDNACYYTISEAVDVVHYSNMTIRRAIISGELKATHHYNGKVWEKKWFINEYDLKEWQFLKNQNKPEFKKKANTTDLLLHSLMKAIKELKSDAKNKKGE